MLLNQQEVFSAVLRAFSFFGLDSQGKLNWAVSVVVLSAVPFCTILLMIVTDYASDVDGQIRVFQIIPLFLVVGFKAANIKTKFADIKTLIATANSMLEEIDDQKILSESFALSIKVLKTALYLNGLPAVIGQITALLTIDTPLPIWVPQRFIEHGTLFFAINWAIFTVSGVSITIISLAMDMMLINVLVTLKGYSQYLGENIEKASTHESERMRKFLKFHEQFWKLQK